MAVSVAAGAGLLLVASAVPVAVQFRVANGAGQAALAHRSSSGLR